MFFHTQSSSRSSIDVTQHQTQSHTHTHKHARDPISRSENIVSNQDETISRQTKLVRSAEERGKHGGKSALDSTRFGLAQNSISLSREQLSALKFLDYCVFFFFLELSVPFVATHSCVSFTKINVFSRSSKWFRRYFSAPMLCVGVPLALVVFFFAPFSSPDSALGFMSWEGEFDFLCAHTHSREKNWVGGGKPIWLPWKCLRHQYNFIIWMLSRAFCSLTSFWQNFFSVYVEGSNNVIFKKQSNFNNHSNIYRL